MEATDYKKNLKRLENQAKRFQSFEGKSETRSLSIKEGDRNLLAIEQNNGNVDISLYVDRILELENETQNLKFDKLEILNNSEEQLERMSKLIEQNELKFKEIEQLKLDLKKALDENNLQLEDKETFYNERESTNLKLLKFSSLCDQLENEKTNYSEEIRIFENKLKVLIIEKEIVIKECEFLKNQTNTNNQFINKIQLEYKELMTKDQNIQIEHESMYIQLQSNKAKIKHLTANNIQRVD